MKELNYIVEENIIVRDYIMKYLSQGYYRYIKRYNPKYYINDTLAFSYSPLHIGDYLRICFEPFFEKQNDANPDICFDIIYEDEHYIVVNKPSNLKSMPTSSSDRNSLYNALISRCRFETDVHLINRLDAKTNGLMLIAKDKLAALLMEKNYKGVERRYFAKVKGFYPYEENIIDKPIKRLNEEEIIRVISDDGKRAITHVKTLERNDEYSVLDIKLDTGRTHQIRLHLSYLGYPIFGDNIYGDGLEEDIMSLESYYLSYVDPFTNQKKEFSLANLYL